MKKIKLVVFNEIYWEKGLIYTQNIQPLLALKKDHSVEIQIIAFTSIFLLISKRKQIGLFKKELNHSNISLLNFPIFLYPSRHFIIYWYLYPYFLINVFPFLFYLSFKDRCSNEDIIYSIRSYMGSLAFLKFYPRKDRLVFDPRTDWILENINVGCFRRDGITHRLWFNWEKEMVTQYRKTIFISDIFKSDILSRHSLIDNSDKYVLLYNPINYSLFDTSKYEIEKKDFLYTGSLGNWNNIRTYLDFFLAIYKYFPNAHIRILTNTPSSKVLVDVYDKKYDEIRQLIDLQFNVPREKLSDLYSCCAYGLQLMKKEDSRVGVKFVEYLAAGIVPIVNENVRGAAYLSRKYTLGVVLSNNYFTEDDVSKLHNIPSINKESENYRKFRSVTDTASIISILENIYLS